MTTDTTIIDFNQHANAAAANRQRATDFTITEMFHVGYRDGRDSVDELSRGTSHKQGLEDGTAGKLVSYDPEVHENVPSVGFASTEDGAYAFGWDVGWRDEVQDEYRKGYAEGRFARLMHVPGV
jgi:hypothetical protein